MMIYVGIDPGLSGAMAVIKRGTVQIVPMPEGKGYPEPAMVFFEFHRLIDETDFCVCVEQTQTRPGQGICSAHRYGYGAGAIHGMLLAMKPRQISIIRPQTWQKHVWAKYGAHGADTKQRTYQAMLNCWPQAAGMLTTARGRLLDGNSDSLAIATWMRDQFVGS
jgi:hypothetical protein